MARRKALYDGHPVAAVAAVSPAIARQALKMIKVDYEVLPHVTDVEAAMAPDAPILHEHIFTEGVQPKAKRPSNVAYRHQFGHGDLDKGFKAADVVIERTFRTEAAHQGYIEPHACLADLKADGSGDIWCCTQGHYMVRTMCASLLGLDISRLRVTASEIGGGFGGKTVVFLEPLALALSRKAGRPVKMVMSREEVFRASGPTASSAMRVKIGIKKDGRLTAGDAELKFQGGAFPGSLVDMGAMAAFACYELENVRVVGYDVVCNRPKLAAYRAPSAPIAAFAVESVIDELAGRIGMDPLELRLKNAAKEGTKSSYGPTYKRIGLVETIEAARKHPHYKAKLAKNQGRGVASGFWFNFGGNTSTSLSINADGTVAVSYGNPDIGGSRASMCMMVAEELGIPYDSVRAIIADTSSLGHNDITDGSRVTFSAGIGVINCARNAIKVLCARAAAIWGIPADAVDLGEWSGEARRAQRRQVRATLAQGDRGAILEHRRADCRPFRVQRRRCRREFRHPHLRRRGRSRDGCGQGRALYGRAGRGQGGASELRRGSNAGRRRAGHRMGAQRGVCLRRGWPAPEPGVPRLPNPGRVRRADDRCGDRRDTEPRPSVWRARRRRDTDRAAARGCRQRHCCSDGDTGEPRADVAATRASGHSRADEGQGREGRASGQER